MDRIREKHRPGASIFSTPRPDADPSASIPTGPLRRVLSLLAELDLDVQAGAGGVYVSECPLCFSPGLELTVHDDGRIGFAPTVCGCDPEEIRDCLLDAREIVDIDDDMLEPDDLADPDLDDPEVEP